MIIGRERALPERVGYRQRPVEVRKELAAARCFPFEIGTKACFFKCDEKKICFASEMLI